MSELMTMFGLKNLQGQNDGNVLELVKNVFEHFCQKIYFDSTQNFKQKKILFSLEESIENVKNGFGLNCQEMFILLKEVLKEAGIDAKIVHGDIYDFELGIIKPLLTSSVMVKYEDKLIHLNPINHLMFELGEDEELKIDNMVIHNVCKEYYVIMKYSDGELYSADKIYTYASELVRVQKIKKKFEDSSIVPYGITNPFYWAAQPERRVFYNVLKDTVRIQIERESTDFSLFEWKQAEESSWLTEEQKDIISDCINDINMEIDEYLSVSDVMFEPFDEDETDISVFDEYTSIDEDGGIKEND